MTEEGPAAHSPVGVCFVKEHFSNNPSPGFVSSAFATFSRPGGILIFNKQTAKENYHRQ